MARDVAEKGLEKVLDKQTREAIALALKAYLHEELDVDVGRFEAEGLLDVVAARLGPHFYNQGLKDAQALLARQLDEFNDALFEMERLAER